MSFINRQKKKKKKEVTRFSRVINPDDPGAIGLLLTKLGRAGRSVSGINKFFYRVFYIKKKCSGLKKKKKKKRKTTKSLLW